MKQVESHLHTFSVLSPDSTTVLLELCRLLFCVLLPLVLRKILGMSDGRFEISFEPTIEASVVRALERCAFRRKRVSHDQPELASWLILSLVS